MTSLLGTLAPVVVADPASPVSVVKTASSNPVASGAQLTYTIVVTNLGGAKVNNIVMTDQVNGVGVIQNPPALPQLTITSTKGTCTQGGPNGNVVTCNAGTMAGREVWTVTIRGQVTAPDNTTLNNTAAVTGTKSAQTFTTTGSASVLVSGGTGGGDPLPDLTINKTGPTSVALGWPMTYTLTINNLGTADTANVKVVDTLPAGVTIDAGFLVDGVPTPIETTSLFVCSTDEPTDPITVTCIGGAVNQGQNATIKIHAISPALGTLITNTSVVDPDNTITESDELNNTSATVNTSLEGPPPAPLLHIAKTDGNPAVLESWASGAGLDPVNPGAILTYKILVRNDATSRADDVRISDTTQGLEASSIIVSQTVVDGAVGVGRGCVVNAAEVVCSVRSLEAGGYIIVTVQGTVIAPAGSTMFNTATVNGNIKNVGVTNTASESTTVRPIIDLNITKVDTPDPACARTWPTSDPDRHLLSDPDGLTAPDGSIPDDPAFPAAEDGLLAPPVCLGGLTYTFVVGNSGNGNATNNVTVRDPLPADVLFDSYWSDAGFVCGLESPDGNIVRCTGGSIPAASTRTLKLRVVAPANVGFISNTVYVDPNNAIFEPDETNNTANASTTISTGVDLVIWKGDSVNPNPPGIGAPTLVGGTSADLGDGYDPIATRGTQTYTIYLDNVGTQDVTGIRVRDTLPADTIFLSAIAYDPLHPLDPTHGFTCTHDGSSRGGVVECIGGHLLGTASEFYDPVADQIVGPSPVAPGDDWATIKIQVFARATVGTMFNEARVDPLNEIVEVNELNNTDTETTTVGVGDSDKGAYHQLTVEKTQVDPAGNDPVATNGILVYELKVSNLGTDPISAIVVKDTLPSGTRFISAKDTDVGTSLSDAFFCLHDGSATGGVVTCLGGDLSGSINKIPDPLALPPFVPEFRTIRITVFAPNTPGTIVNLATVDPDNQVPEGNEFDNDAFEDTIVAPCVGQADCTNKNAVYELTISKDQNRPAIARNGLETYTLTITNLGSDPISGVRVEDYLPAGSRFFDAKDTAVPPSDPSAFTCSHDGSLTGGTVTCVGGVLDGTADTLGASVPTSRSIQIRAFMPDTPGTYTNRSVVDPANTIPEGNEFNNESSIETVVSNGGPFPYIDLHVVKTQELLAGQELNQDATVGPTGVSLVAPGDPVFYKLVVSNGGEADAFNVVVRDVLPANMTYFTAFDPAAASPDQFSCGLVPGETHTIECIGARIPAGGSRTINIFAFAPEGLDQTAPNLGDIKQLLIDTAFVDPDNAIGEGDEANNEDFEQTIVRSKINLTADKDGPDNASQNQEDDYTIDVENHTIWGGGDIAVDAVVIDTLPVGLIPLSVTTSGGNFLCNILENPVNTLMCVGDLEAGQKVTITVHVFITQEDGTMYNQACIDPDHLIDETNELDNCDIKTTNVGENPPPQPPAAPNLNINKSASTSVVTPGQTFTYTVSVSNVGTGPSAAPLAITDDLSTLPVTFVSAVATNGFTCGEAASVVTCTGASGLAAGGSTVITIQVTVTGAATTAFTNTASVPDPAEADGTAEDSVTTSVGGAAVELVLANVEDAPDPVAAGAVITYTIVVANAGTSDATGLDITQTFGDTTGLTFLSAVGSQGFTCSFSDPVVTCTGTLLAGQSTVLTVRFDTTAAAVPSVFSVIEVDPTAEFGEADESNNIDFEATTVSADICQNCIDLVMGPIFVNPDPVANGDTVTWDLDITNVGDLPTGTDPAPNNVAFTINIDGGFNEYQNLLFTAPAGWTCVVNDHGGTGNAAAEISCTKSNMNAGEGVLLSVSVDANTAADPSVLFFTAQVDPGSLITEINEANNTGSNPATVDTPPPGP